MTINTPPELDYRQRAFRWIGIYCSTDCLLADDTRLRQQEQILRDELGHGGFTSRSSEGPWRD